MPEPDFYDPAILRKVAKWFHEEQRTKKFIRELLKSEVGRSPNPRTLDKMLGRARTDGIVLIDFPNNPSPERRLEGQLKDKFLHLEKAIVVRDQEEYGDLLTRWGEAAARYFDQLVAEGRPLHVGISGGETLLSFANAVTECQREHVHIYTSALVGRGRLRDEASHVDPLVNATVLWAKCGRLPGHCHYATVPPYDALTRGQIGGELRELLKRQPIREVIADMNRINVAFAGLGLVKPTNPGLANQLTMTGLLEEIVPREALDREGATGDLAYCLFDETGNRSTKYNWEFFLTAGACGDDPEGRGLGFYKQMVKDRKQKKKVIVIAGSLKQPAIGPALKAKLFNVWITDANTARWALRKL